MKKLILPLILCMAILFTACQNINIDLGVFSKDVYEFSEKYNSGRNQTSLQEGMEIVSCVYAIDEESNKCNIHFTVKNMTGEAVDVSFRIFSSDDLRKYTDAYEPLDSDFGLKATTLNNEDSRTMNIVLEFKSPYTSLSEDEKAEFLTSVETIYVELLVDDVISYLPLAVEKVDEIILT